MDGQNPKTIVLRREWRHTKNVVKYIFTDLNVLNYNYFLLPGQLIRNPSTLTQETADL